MSPPHPLSAWALISRNRCLEEARDTMGQHIIADLDFDTEGSVAVTRLADPFWIGARVFYERNGDSCHAGVVVAEFDSRWGDLDTVDVWGAEADEETIAEAEDIIRERCVEEAGR